MKKLKIEYVSVSELKDYENNAKIHTPQQIEQIKKSIEQFGMNDPIAVWKDNVIIEGHGRVQACKDLGIDQVPIIRLDGLSDQQRKSYALIHNKLTMNSDFDLNCLHDRLEEITDIDMSFFGFDTFVDQSIDDFFETGVQTKQQDDLKVIKLKVKIPKEDKERLIEILDKYHLQYEEQ